MILLSYIFAFLAFAATVLYLLLARFGMEATVLPRSSSSPPARPRWQVH